jgi:hypothetical protein
LGPEVAAFALEAFARVTGPIEQVTDTPTV